MKMKLFAGFILVAAMLCGQGSGDELVTVQRKYVSNDGMRTATVQQTKEKVSGWTGIGKEVGEATREALNSVVDVSDKFSKTDVGHFVLFMVAWHILGDRLLHVVLGIPIFIGGGFVWFILLRRLFTGVRVLVKENVANKTKEWQIKSYQWQTGDSRSAAAVVLAAAGMIWVVACMCVIFA